MKIFIAKNGIIYKNNLYEYENTLELYKEFHKNTLQIILLEEELHVQCLDIPNCKKRYLSSIVENEVKENFKNWESILYNYSIVKKENQGFKILINYIYSENLRYIKLYSKSLKIQYVYPIQLIATKKFNKINRNKVYTILFKYNEIFYVCAYYKNLIIGTAIINKIELKNKGFLKVEKFLDIVQEMCYELELDFCRYIYIYLQEEIIKKANQENLEEELNNFLEDCDEIQI